MHEGELKRVLVVVDDLERGEEIACALDERGLIPEVFPRDAEPEDPGRVRGFVHRPTDGPVEAYCVGRLAPIRIRRRRGHAAA